MRKLAYFLPFIALAALLDGCAKTPSEPPACDSFQTPITFETDVASIMGSCAYTGCHDGNYQPDASGRIVPYNFNNYEDVRHVVENGQFERYVFHNKGDSLQGMPPRYAGGPLDDFSYLVLRCWLDSGHPKDTIN
jgi:hypothetical protein